MKLFFSLFFLSSLAFAGHAEFGYLKPEDQKFYKNDSMDGNNVRDRIDSTVKEINKVYGEMSAMKAEILQLRAEVEELKKKK